MAIRMISGFTSFCGRMYGPKDGVVSMDDDAEARLVSLGVAEYAAVTAPAVLCADSIPGKGVDASEPENGAEAATEGVETLYEPQDLDMGAMTMAELKALAESIGVSVKGLRSKAAVIEAIEAANKPPNPKVIE